jgi:hypothetical protein
VTPGLSRERILRLKSLVALVLLVSFAAASLEAVAGVVRDGAVHHESTARAAAHADLAAGEHGHEDAASPHRPSDSEGHEHGTSSDHCTHTHRVAALASAPRPTATSVLDVISTEIALPRAFASDAFVPPPQA